MPRFRDYGCFSIAMKPGFTIFHPLIVDGGYICIFILFLKNNSRILFAVGRQATISRCLHLLFLSSILGSYKKKIKVFPYGKLKIHCI